MKKEYETHKQIAAEISRSIVDNITEIKRFLGLSTYEEVFVSLVVAGKTADGLGVTEEFISSTLGLSRSTVNRTVKRLLDAGELSVVCGSRPRRLVYNYRYTDENDRPLSREETLQLTNHVLSANINSVKKCLILLLSSQYDKSDDSAV